MSHPLSTGGEIRSIVRWGKPILHREARDVQSFDDELARLGRDMFATMDAAHGAGLAANQVDVDLKVFVFDFTSSQGVRTTGIVCNPVVELPQGNAENQTKKVIEGCLSLPGVCAECPRPKSVTVRGVDQRGQPVEIHASGALAGILQHEVDHLYGTVYGDRLHDELRERLHNKHNEAAGQYPDDWPVSKSTHDWETVF